MKALRLLAAALLIPALAASCADIPTSQPEQAQAPEQGARLNTGSFWINCSGSVMVGGTGWCSAYPYSGGFIYPSYWSSNPGVLQVYAGGTLVGVNPGTAWVYASSGGYMSSTIVSVYAPPPPAVVSRVTVSSATVYPGGSAQLVARAYDASNNQITGRAVTWSIDNPGVATISASGVTTGQALGSTTARATIDGVAGAGTVWVEEYQEPEEPMCGKYLC